MTREDRMRWRMWLAAVCLVIGVDLLITSGTTGPRWLGILGSIALAFVAPLIIDQAKRER